MVGVGGSKNWSFFVDVINGWPLANITSWQYCNPHFWNGHVIDSKMLMFWIGGFTAFVHIWSRNSRIFYLGVVYLSKGRFYRISSWKYCNPYFWNGHVTNSKLLMLWFCDFITFVKTWFELSIFRSFYLRAV